MRNVVFLLFLLFSSLCSLAKDKKASYDIFDKREHAVILDDSCKRNYISSCFELGLLYQTFTGKKFKNDGIKYSELSKKLIAKSCDNGEQNACDYIHREDRFEGSKLVLWSAIILIGIATLLITTMIFSDNEQFQAKQQLEDGEEEKNVKVKDHGVILQFSKPFFKRYLSPVVSGMKNKKSIQDKYKKKLANAGLTNVLTSEDFFAFKLFLIIGFPIMYLSLKMFLETDWPLKMIPLVGVLGYVYPNIWIKGKIEGRQKDIVGGMPFSVDMLALSVEAGLDFVAAITKVVEKGKGGPLLEEFEILIREIKVGASRAEALRNMSWRVDLMQISSFCATLIAADSVGASIGPILKALSEEVRQKRSADVEKEGATAATKILFPMMAFILPAVILMVFAPMVVDFIG